MRLNLRKRKKRGNSMSMKRLLDVLSDILSDRYGVRIEVKTWDK